MGKIDTLFNIAVYGTVGYAIYKLWPTIKGFGGFIGESIETLNKGGSWLTSGLKDVVDTDKSFLNPQNWDSSKEKPKTTFTSWENMSYNQAKEFGVVDEWRTKNKLTEMKTTTSSLNYTPAPKEQLEKAKSSNLKEKITKTKKPDKIYYKTCKGKTYPTRNKDWIPSACR
jgi:hypothetical protein